MSKPAKKYEKIPVDGIIGKATCRACRAGDFRIDIYHGGGWTVRCSHCEEEWSGQDGPK